MIELVFLMIQQDCQLHIICGIVMGMGAEFTLVPPGSSVLMKGHFAASNYKLAFYEDDDNDGVIPMDREGRR